MEKQQLNRQEIQHCLYSGGFISCLIKKLLETYEAYQYQLIDLRKIGVESYAISSLPREDEIWRRSIEVRKLDDDDLIILGLNPNDIINFDTVFLPSSDMIDKYCFITQGINKDTLKKYPYIQEFIDYLNNLHKASTDEVEFVRSMKNYLGSFLASKKGEINHHIYENFEKKDETCKMNRAVFFNVLKYIAQKFDRSVDCVDDVHQIIDASEESKSTEVVHEFVIFSKKGKFGFETEMGIKSDDVDIKDFYYNSEIDVQYLLHYLAVENKDLFNNFIAIKYFAFRLYELTREKDFIENSDIEVILADICNEYKRTRKRKSN